MGEVTEEQLQAWRDKIEDYKRIYANMYNGKKPSDKLILSFCKIYSIPWPLPKVEGQMKAVEDWDFLS